MCTCSVVMPLPQGLLKVRRLLNSHGQTPVVVCKHGQHGEDPQVAASTCLHIMGCMHEGGPLHARRTCCFCVLSILVVSLTLSWHISSCRRIMTQPIVSIKSTSTYTASKNDIAACISLWNVLTAKDAKPCSCTVLPHATLPSD